MYLTIISTLFAMLFAVAPDCAYTRYGCTYLIWYHDDGHGDVLSSCDQGATYFWYTGRVGTCPGLDNY